MFVFVYVSVCVCVKAQLNVARDAWSLPNEATGVHCTVSTFHTPDSTLTDVIPAGKNTVSINKQLLCGIQATEDHCQLSAPQAAHNYVASCKHLFMYMCRE